jgi:site-specific DNA-methyltransferase (adenine-specific)
MHSIAGQTLIHADSLHWMLQQPTSDPFDVVVADPPYCAATRGGRVSQSSATKYTSSDAKRQFLAFDGDSRDQRSFQLWTAMWSGAAYRLTREGGALLAFIDFRNVAAMVDAIQAGGWCYDGVIPWLKSRGRPRLGWFQTSQTEYVVVGRKGATDRSQRRCGPAYVQSPAPSKRVHPTQKPVEVITSLLEFRPDWQRILDPFGGAATTAVAALQLGREATVIESNEEYYRLGRERLVAARATPAVRLAA